MMRIAFACFAALLAACGGTTTGDTADSGPAFDYCAEVKARTARCEAGTFDEAQCTTERTCYDKIVRPEDKNALLNCFATRACGVSDDTCAGNAAAKYTSDPVVTAWAKSCTERRTACSNSFADDYCTAQFGLFTDAIRAQLKACLDKPCADIASCLEVPVAAAGCK